MKSNTNNTYFMITGQMKKSTTKWLMQVFIVSVVFSACALKKPEVGEKVIFKTDIAEDATPHVLERILSSKSNPISIISFEKGIYHFYPDKGLEAFVHISNHNDVMTRTAFPLKDLKNLTIDGNGSSFIFHGGMIPFLIDEGSNITIQNLSIDWAESFHSEGLVIANDEKKGSFDLQISDEYPYIIRNDQLIFIKEYYEHSLGQAILYDPNRKAIAFETEAYTPLTLFGGLKTKRNIENIRYKYKVDSRSPQFRMVDLENSLKVEEIKPGVVRIYNHRKKLPQVGLILVCKGTQGENRLAPAIRLTNVINFKANNVNIHHAGGMGLIAENCTDIVLDNFNITASKGRMVSTTADATHFVGCRGKVVLRNSTFMNQLDDASNVHGTYQEIVDILDKHTLGVRMGHFQQQGFCVGMENDTIGLIRLSNSFFPYNKLTIKSIEYINGRYQKIKFNEPIPSSVEIGDLVENLDAYPEFLVENCTISNNRARGLLLSTPRKTVIRNNFFHTEMEALLIPVESGHWFESGSVTNLLVEGNTFQDCNHSGFNRGIIRFETDDDNENIAFKNIVFKNNTINHFDNLVLEITNTENLVFENNTITRSGTFTPLFPNRPVIAIKSSVNIKIDEKVYSGKTIDLSLLEDKTFADMR